jgi:hypothetical protein
MTAISGGNNNRRPIRRSRAAITSRSRNPIMAVAAIISSRNNIISRAIIISRSGVGPHRHAAVLIAR